MLSHIRPHQLFTRVRTPGYGDRLVSVVLPHDSTPKLLETAVLLALIRVVRPRAVFEFGTYLGIQTLNMAANVDPGARVYTLDLDHEAFRQANQLPADRDISRRHLEHHDRLAFQGTQFEDRVEILLGDSTTFDFSPYAGTMDLIYIDGGHDARTVRSDTEQAFLMLSDDRDAVICWHDYGNPTYPAVTAEIERVAGSRDMFHIEETMMCFHLREPAT
jgi:predicted O-methyltransferase YrrM